MAYYIDEDDGQIKFEPDRMQPTGDLPPPSDEGDIIVTGFMRHNPSLYNALVWGTAAAAYNAAFVRLPGHSYEEYPYMVNLPRRTRASMRLK